MRCALVVNKRTNAQRVRCWIAQFEELNGSYRASFAWNRWSRNAHWWAPFEGRFRGCRDLVAPQIVRPNHCWNGKYFAWHRPRWDWGAHRQWPLVRAGSCWPTASERCLGIHRARSVRSVCPSARKYKALVHLAPTGWSADWTRRCEFVAAQSWGPWFAARHIAARPYYRSFCAGFQCVNAQQKLGQKRLTSQLGLRKRWLEGRIYARLEPL